MADYDELKRLIDQQLSIAQKISEASEMASLRECGEQIEALKKQSAKLQAELSASKKKQAALLEQNTELYQKLQTIYRDGRAQALSESQTKATAFFNAMAESENAKMGALVSKLKHVARECGKALEGKTIQAEATLLPRLNELSAATQAALDDYNATMAEYKDSFQALSAKEHEELRVSPLDVRTEPVGEKKNSWEQFVGTSLASKAGIIFLILGLISLARFSMPYLTDYVKMVLMFSASAALFGWGFTMNRKTPGPLSKGLEGGGIASCFVSITVSALYLEVMPVPFAALLCAAACFGAFYLANIRNSQTIAALAIIGGYSPLVLAVFDNSLAYYAAAYFFVLSVLALSFAMSRKWTSVSLISFFLNLASICSLLWIANDYASDNGLRFVIFPFALLSCAVYSTLPVLGNLRAKRSFSMPDALLMGANALFGSIAVFAALYAANLDIFDGALALVFCLLYAGLGYLAKGLLKAQPGAKYLYFSTAIAFSAAAIPIQFGESGLFVGWLIEGTIWAAIGYLKSDDRFKTAGFIALIMCAFRLFFYDWIFFTWLDQRVYGHMMLAIGALITLFCMIYTKSLSKAVDRIALCLILLDTLFLGIHMISVSGMPLPIRYFSSLGYCALWALALIHMKLFKGKDITFICAVVMTISSVMMIGGPTSGDLSSGQLLALLAAASLVWALAMHGSLKIWMRDFYLAPNTAAIIFAFIFVGKLAFMLTTIFDDSLLDFLATLSYSLIAVGCAVYGFAFKDSLMRRIGLCFALGAMVKLFLTDMANLTGLPRVLSFFAMGGALLAISYAYQFFTKRFADAEEDDRIRAKFFSPPEAPLPAAPDPGNGQRPV
ncbi:MAG: DUF2339 domain-containing protein [Clostridiales bacterium]|nr:DUF2339 domain-containing protein [Clostridiales bacterium]